MLGARHRRPRRHGRDLPGRAGDAGGATRRRADLRARVAGAAARARARVGGSAGGAGGRRAAPIRRRTSRSMPAASWCGPAPSRATRNGTPVGVVIASDFLSGDLARHARRIAEAYEDYSQLRVLKRPLEGVYLSLFLMMTLLILVSATWLGLYLAKRITRPVAHAGGRRAGDRRRPSRSSHRAGDARRVRLAGRGLQRDGGRAGDEPEAARSIAARPRAQELRARRAPPLHRDDPRADCHRRDLDRPRRPRQHDQRARRCGCSTSTQAIVGAPADAGVRARGSAAARAR